MAMDIEESAEKFWINELSDVQPTHFPVLPSLNYQPKPNTTVEHCVTDVDVVKLAQYFRAYTYGAWSILLSQYTDSSDVVFGACTGSGSVTAVTPCVVRVDWSSKVGNFIRDLESQTSDAEKFSHIGYEHIRRLSTPADHACRFQSTAFCEQQESCCPAQFQGADDTNANVALALRCALVEKHLRIRLSVDIAVVDKTQAHRMTYQFAQGLQKLLELSFNTTDAKLNDIDTFTSSDEDSIWSWNSLLPRKAETCMHRLIEDQVKMHPDVLAVESWDGTLTYSQFNAYATNLAACLVKQGVVIGQKVPFCFNRSLWTPVTIFALAKLGAAFVALDKAQPEARLRTIVTELGSTIVLCRPDTKELAEKFNVRTLVIDEKFFFSDQSVGTSWPSPSPEDLLYIVFTSGSTGTPKGAQISNSNFCTGALHQAKALGFCGDRTFDSTSYSFDVYVLNTLSTLATGGCLCIPTEWDRINNLENTLRSMQINLVALTPPAIRLLNPSTLPSLRTLMFAGEKVNREDVLPWLTTGRVKLVNAYGPAECSVVSAANIGFTDPDDAPKIGRGLATNLWIADLRNVNNLAPIGAIGELLVESPLVGQGYLNDSEKTQESFLPPPNYLPGKFVPLSEPLYRTRDLVRYCSDGSITYIGRSDFQIKWNGQRVELGEIEHQLKGIFLQKVEVAVEVVELPSTLRQLIGFIFAESTTEHDLVKQFHGFRTKLSKLLPHYMIPSSLYPLSQMPISATGKLDRKQLREMAIHNPDKLFEGEVAQQKMSRSPTTRHEMILHQFWTDIFQAQKPSITANDSFFRFGDSLSAIQLVAKMRKEGYDVSVADIFQKPRLSELAAVVGMRDLYRTDYDVGAFQFHLNGSEGERAAMIEKASQLCGVRPEDIEDLYPCSPMQEAMLAATAKNPGSFSAQEVIRVSEGTDLHRLVLAWTKLIERVAILRTRVTSLPQRPGLTQVVLNGAPLWSRFSDLAQCQRQAKIAMTGLNQPLTRFAIVKEPQENHTHIVITMHHAVCDGWFIGILMKELKNLYEGKEESPVLPYRNFIRHLEEVNATPASEYWKIAMEDLDASIFPELPEPGMEPGGNAVIHHTITGAVWTQNEQATPNTIIRAAWAILISKYTYSSDVVFGATVIGRQGSLVGIENIGGPTIATVPVRVKLEYDAQNAQDILQIIQAQAMEMVPFEHFGLNNIRKLNADTKQACKFQSLLVVQPSTFAEESEDIFSFGKAGEDIEAFNTYVMMLECTLTQDGVKMRISFDDSIMHSDQVQLVAFQLEHLIIELCKGPPSTPLKSINMTTDQDRQWLWSRNPDVPQAVDACVQDLLSIQVKEHSNELAICAWDGELTYSQLDRASGKLAHELLRDGVAPGIVPFCLEKSVKSTVVILAIIKAGGTFVALDPELPPRRLMSIVKDDLGARMILASPKTANLAQSLVPAIKVIYDDILHLSTLYEMPASDDVRSIPSDSLYIVFTSGSTGKPKGFVISHSNLCSAVNYQARKLGFNEYVRSFDSSSYSFDAYVFNTFYTILTGGCLCVPSDSDRVNNLLPTLRQMRVTLAQLVPSVARVLDPQALPDLQTLILTGEPLNKSDLLPWLKNLTVVNAYGPSECTIMCAANTAIKSDRDRHSIGVGLGVNIWLVDPNTCSLTAVGAVGELLIEGPLIGQGYLNDIEKTEQSREVAPPWLRGGFGKFPGRSSELFRTGDLAKYNIDGSLSLLGRMDSQLKLRGQRFEAGEVEFQLQQKLPRQVKCAVEIVESSSLPKQLIAFLELPVGTSVRKTITGLSEKLLKVLPRHMIPSKYLTVNSIPMTASDKTDRRKLKRLAIDADRGAFMSDKLSMEKTDQDRPRSSLELDFRQLWANALSIPESTVSISDNFFELGGDSILAMQLVASAQERGYNLNVKQIFNNPHLSDMAALSTQNRTSVLTRQSPTTNSFPGSPIHRESVANDDGTAITTAGDERKSSLNSELTTGSSSIVKGGQAPLAPQVLLRAWDIDLSNAAVTLPVTDFQRRCLQSAFLRPRAEWKYFSIYFRHNLDVQRLVAACQKLCDIIESFRTVFVKQQDEFFQVVLKHSDANVEVCTVSTSLREAVSSICEHDHEARIQLGAPFTKFFILQDSTSGSADLVLRLSHAQYDDASSLMAIAEVMKSVYNGHEPPKILGFSDFVMKTRQHTSESYSFWTQLLKGSSLTRLPANAARDNPFWKHTHLHARIQLPRPTVEVASETILTAGWGFALSRVLQKDDVTFGRVVSGKKGLFNDVERVIGACVNEVPVRVTFPSHETIATTLLQLQKHCDDSVPHENVQLSEIIAQCTDWPSDATFGSVLEIQDDVKLSRSSIPGHDVELDVVHVAADPGPSGPLRVMARSIDTGFDIEVLLPKGSCSLRLAHELLGEFCGFFYEKFND